MRKHLFCFIIFAFTVNYTVLAQSLSWLISECEKAENAETMKMSSSSIGHDYPEDIYEMTKNLDETQIIYLNECPDKVKDNLIKQFRRLKDADGYETLTMLKTEDCYIRFIAKKEKDMVKEMIIIVHSEGTLAVTKLAKEKKELDIYRIRW